MTTASWVARYLGAAVLVAAVIVARRPDAVTMPQFWAEDGSIFFKENLLLGFLTALAKGYHGFPQLVHRLIGYVGGLVPLAEAPRVYTTAAIALTALMLAMFALPAFRHVVRSDALRMLFGVAVASAPFRQEVLATPTNIGWFTAVWLALVGVMRLPGSGWALAGLAVAAGVAIFSTPLSVVGVPIWLVRAWTSVRTRTWRVAGFWATLLVAQAVVFVLAWLVQSDAQRSGLLGADARYRPFEIIASPRMLAFTLDRVVEVVWPLPGGTVTLGVAGVLACWAGLVVGLLGASAAGGFRTAMPLLVLAYFLLATALVYAAGRPLLVAVPSSEVAGRYAVFPTALAVLTLLVLLDDLPQWPRRVCGAVVAVVLAVLWQPSFAVEPLRDVEWPTWAGRLEQKLASGSRVPMSIPSNPPWNPIVFDPVDWHPATVPAPNAVLGGLGTHGGFKILFRSECAGLAAVEIALAAARASARGDLAVSLVDDESGRAVLWRRLPRAGLALDGSPLVVAFDPLASSRDRGYTFRLQAVGNDVEATILVMGWSEDRDSAESLYGGQTLAGDAAFRYGCIPATKPIAR